MARIAVLAVIWGWSFLFIKVGVEGMTPTTVAAGRMALGASVLMGVLAAQRRRLPRWGPFWRHAVVMGVLASAIPFTLLAWGEERITSALASVLNASTPLFAAVFAALFLGERLRRSQLAGLVLGFAGVAVAAGIGGADVTGSSLAGSAAAVGAAACYGYTFVYARRHLSGVAPAIAAAAQLIVGTAVAAPPALATSVAVGIDPEPHRLLAVALLGAVGTGFAYLLYYRTIADLGPTRASLVTYLVPIVAVAVGVAFLHEPFRLRLVAGGLLTIAGIALLRERQPQEKETVAVTGEPGSATW